MHYFIFLADKESLIDDNAIISKINIGYKKSEDKERFNE